MKMSTRGRYGLRIMTELASRFGTGPVPVEAVAESQGLSPTYIHQLANGLKEAGLLRAVRGPNGGYELAREPDEITAYDVVAVLEGGVAPVECVADPSSCSRSPGCSARMVWSEAAQAMEGVLASVTLADLAGGSRAANERACGAAEDPQRLEPRVRRR